MDELATQMRQGKIMMDNIFELFDYTDEGGICSVKYRCAWLLVDNGYLNWSNTIPPMKQTMFYKETRWSEWLESMRKDVECTFGILKGRWRILKSGVRLHGVDATDHIWRTCCALHNMLLDVDDYTEEWDGELGQFYEEDIHNIPFAIQRLIGSTELRNYDVSGMGCGQSTDVDVDDNTISYPSLETTTTNMVQNEINDS